MSTHRNVFGLRFRAIMEMLVGLILLVLLDQFFFSGDAFQSLQPNPLWILVLIIAAAYGVNEAILAMLLATAIYLYFVPFPPRLEDQDSSAYYMPILLKPLLYFVIAIAVGALAERHIRKVVRLENESEDAHQREEVITESYHFVKNRKEDLEVQLAGRLTSAIEAYRAAKAIETLNPKDVLRGVEELVRSILNPEQFSVYTLENNKLVANVLYGWSQDDQYRQDFDAKDKIYQSIVGSRQTICIANSDEEVILNRQGVLAGPIMDPDGTQVIGMLKIERIAFTNLGLQTLETFKALSDWIGSALVNAEYYQSVKEDCVVNPEHNLMTHNFFKRQSDYLQALAKRAGFDLSLIVVRLNNADKLEDQDRLSIARQLSQAVQKALRTVDLAFEYQDTGEEYSILLPATSKQGASVVQAKITKELESANQHFAGTGFSYHITALHEA